MDRLLLQTTAPEDSSLHRVTVKRATMPSL